MFLKEAEEKHKLEKDHVCFVYIRFVDGYNTFAIPSPLMLIFFNIPQLLKKAAEYKLQVKAMKEQESDMKIQVQNQGIMGKTGLFSYTL